MIGGGSVIVSVTTTSVIVSVTRDQAGDVFLGVHEEGGDGNRLVPVSPSESGSAENFVGLFTMFLKGDAEEGDVFVASLSLVLVAVVLFGFGLRCTRRGARGFSCFGTVRCVRTLLETLKLASTDGLNVRKS